MNLNEYEYKNHKIYNFHKDLDLIKIKPEEYRYHLPEPTPEPKFKWDLSAYFPIVMTYIPSTVAEHVDFMVAN